MAPPPLPEWMQSEPLARVLGALARAEIEARAVGGCVRDWLAGREGGDIDLATPALPDAVTHALRAAKLKAVPTGIAHGTITAVADGEPFEITTLRRDVSTDGRRATVAFTDCWKEDAARRDFTFNALYLTPSGEWFDYFGGREDLAEGRVRFIGQARDRIREDYLRILRFFRFYAYFGQPPMETEALAACAELAEGISQLSGERIRQEMLKLLMAEDPLPALEAMAAHGIAPQVFLLAPGIEALRRLMALERAHAVPPDALCRLAALCRTGTEALAARWKLSRKEAETLTWLAQPSPLAWPELEIKRLILRAGKDRAANLALVSAAREDDAAAPARCDEWLAIAARWNPPPFPVTGRDLLALGIPSGPEMGETLKALENAWLASDGALGKAELLAKAGGNAPR